MERSEKIGLGIALTGHVLLFGLLSVNLIWDADKPKLGDPTIAVTIAGEPGSSEVLSDIPLPIATPEPADTEDVVDEATPAEEPVQTPPEIIAAAPPSRPTKIQPPDRTAELARQREAQRQREAASKRKREAEARANRDAAAAKRRAAIANAVNAANSGPPAKSAGQVKGEVNIAIGRQIRPFLAGCTPNGIDIRSITTRVTLALNQDGALTGISGVRQTGINDNNRPQAGPMETCVISAIRRAAPFSGLDQDYYDIWRNHKMAFRGT